MIVLYFATTITFLLTDLLCYDFFSNFMKKYWFFFSVWNGLCCSSVMYLHMHEWTLTLHMRFSTKLLRMKLHMQTLLCCYCLGLDTVQDFLIKLGIKPRMHLWEISILSLNNVIAKPTKIMNKADKNWAQF